jgi:hypothetical protein
VVAGGPKVETTEPAAGKGNGWTMGGGKVETTEPAAGKGNGWTMGGGKWRRRSRRLGKEYVGNGGEKVETTEPAAEELENARLVYGAMFHRLSLIRL